jgi:hypothetical protein
MDEYSLHHLVHDDALEAWRELEVADSPRRRRAYVRTVFAAIEALTFMLKRAALRGSQAVILVSAYRATKSSRSETVHDISVDV